MNAYFFATVDSLTYTETMQLLLIVVTFLTFGIHKLSARSCPANWSLVGLSCYLSIKYTDPVAGDRTRTAAQTRCQQLGGQGANLVSINDEQEDQTVNLIRRLSGISDDCYYWIGLDDQGEEQTFVWQDGTVATYTNWASGEPTSRADPGIDPAIGESEDYVVASGALGWKDVTSDWTDEINGMQQPAGFVCERNTDPPPMMSSENDGGELAVTEPEGPGSIASPESQNQDTDTTDNSNEDSGGTTNSDNSNDGDNNNDMTNLMSDGSSQGDTASSNLVMNSATQPVAEKGEKGAMGEPGEQGPQGSDGLPGTRGPRGRPGRRGNKGEQGDSGLPGQNGDAGVPGVMGSPGDKGDKGDPGDPGIPGEQGIPGQDGQQGPVGPKGEKGSEGPEGPPGVMGPPGPPASDSMELLATRIMNDTEAPQTVPYFVNATAFCSGREVGAYPHPLHCWQFIACGSIFGGDAEMTCYAGRSFMTSPYPQCNTDAGCVWGAPSDRSRAWSAALIKKDYPVYEEELLRMKKVMMYNAGGLLIIGLIVMALSAAVMKMYCQKNSFCRKKATKSSVCSDFTYMSGQV